MNVSTKLGALLVLAGVGLGTALAQDSRPASQPTSKPVQKAGKTAPDFTLKDVKGQAYTLSEITKQGKIVVLEWFNPDCPFVKKHHKANKTMAKTFAKYKDKDVVWVAINSGAPGKQGYGADRNKRAIEQYGIHYPVLLDESGDVGRLYKAKTTPHMFVIDKSGNIVYEGAIDNDRARKKLGSVNYVDAALEATLAGKSVKDAVARPYGCSVKYGKK